MVDYHVILSSLLNLVMMWRGATRWRKLEEIDLAAPASENLVMAALDRAADEKAQGPEQGGDPEEQHLGRLREGPEAHDLGCTESRLFSKESD